MRFLSIFWGSGLLCAVHYYIKYASPFLTHTPVNYSPIIQNGIWIKFYYFWPKNDDEKWSRKNSFFWQRFTCTETPKNSYSPILLFSLVLSYFFQRFYEMKTVAKIYTIFKVCSICYVVFLFFQRFYEMRTEILGDLVRVKWKPIDSC